MARKLRLEFAGAVYHVINRGNYQKPLFAEAGAAAAFERCLDEACRRFQWRVHAFVIMRNHFHLAVETPLPNLSLGMKYLQGTWVNRFNRYRRQIGRPFQGRYKGTGEKIRGAWLRLGCRDRAIPAVLDPRPAQRRSYAQAGSASG